MLMLLNKTRIFFLPRRSGVLIMNLVNTSVTRALESILEEAANHSYFSVLGSDIISLKILG